uniref:WD repeat domain 63 n=1 Tax=Stegastes partitus TaxID=144197 RepID=A0A3B5AIP0_9TELE
MLFAENLYVNFLLFINETIPRATMAPKKPTSGRSSTGSKGKGKSECHPDDVFPLVLTSATQELFGCRTDEDVTVESPHKLLKKDDIIHDIKTRAAVSDFSPVKQIVLDYPEEEILLVFDRDFTYGQSFYLVVTPEAKDRILSPPEPETPEVFENEVSETPHPKHWISFGSEQEIDDESVTETRKKALQYIKNTLNLMRKKFGRPVCFSDLNAADAKDSCVECASYKDSRFSIKQMQRDCGMQAVPRLQSSSAQTQWKFHKNVCTQYYPQELHEEEINSILQSESLMNFLSSATSRVLHALQQEEILNMLLDDWKALGTLAEAGDSKVSEDLMLHHAFTDQKYTKDKKVSSVNWHPTILGKVKSLREQSCLSEIDSLCICAFFFFLQLLLECPDDILAFEFCPSNPNIIVGGCVNGQVVLWDISAYITHLQGTQPGDKKGSKTPVVRYCAVSALESRHKAPITDVQWLPQTFEVTRKGVLVENMYNVSVQVVTCSPDCTVMIWDVRVPKPLNQSLSDRQQNVDQKTPITPYIVPETFKHLDRTWKPLLRVSVPKINTSGEYAPLKFSLEHYTSNSNTGRNSGLISFSATIFRIMSLNFYNVVLFMFLYWQDGEIVFTDWKLEKEGSGQYIAKPLLCFRMHHWFVNTIQRSPFFRDIILMTGGWNFAIWKEDVMEGPIVVSPSSEQKCTVGCWSLSRPAVFFIGKDDGSIEVWNLLENTSEPAHVHAHVTSAKITCIKPWTVSRKFFASLMHKPTASSHVTKYFELEEDRLKDYLKRNELWVKEKKKAEELKKKTVSCAF